MLGWNILPHSAYSQYLALTDFKHFDLYLMLLKDKTFQTELMLKNLLMIFLNQNLSVFCV